MTLLFALEQVDYENPFIGTSIYWAILSGNMASRGMAGFNQVNVAGAQN